MAKPGVFISFVGDAKSVVSAAAQARTALGALEKANMSAATRIGSSMQAAGKSMATAGKSATRFLTLPILGVGVAAVKLAADYGMSMNTLQAVTSATSTEMARLDSLAKQLGADMSLPGTSAKDAADAMTELAKAGMSVNETAAAAKGVLQLSAAAQIDNATAATIAAAALNSFNLEAKESGRVADILAATANASSAEITDVAQALSQSSAVWASNGASIEELATSIGLMANAGIKGSDAGTSLKTMMMRLVAPTAGAQKAMDKLGVSVFDSQGKMRPFRSIVKAFSPALAKLTQKQRAAALSTIFGSDAVRGATVVLGGGVKAFDAMTTAATEQGAAAKVSGAKMKGLGGALEGLKSTAETALISIGEALAPAITSLSKSLAGALDAFNKLDPGMKTTIVTFLAIAAAAGPVLFIVGTFTSGIGKMVKGFDNGVKAGKALHSGLGKLAGGFRNANVANSAFSGRLGTLGGKLRHPITAMKDLGTAAGRMTKSIVTSIGRGAKAAAVSTGKMIASFARASAAAVMNGARMVVSFLATAASAIAAGAATAAAWLLAAAPFILIGAAVAGAVYVIIKNWDAIKGFFTRLPGQIIRLFAGAGKWLLAAGKAVITGLWNGYKAMWTTALTWLRGLGKIIIDAFVAAGKWLFRAGKWIITGLWDGIKEIWRLTGLWFGKLGTWIKDKFVAAVDWLFGAGKEIITGLWDGMKSKLGAVLGWLAGLRANFVATKGPPATDRKMLFGAGVMIMQGLERGLRSGLGDVEGVLRQVNGAIGQVGGSPTVGLSATSRLAPVSTPALQQMAAASGMAGLARAGVPGARSSGGGVVSIGHVTIMVNGAQDPRKVAEEVRRELLKLGRRNPGLGLG